MSAGSEAFEEGLQSIIEPYIWQAVSGKEARIDWEETLYGALMGIGFGGIGSAAGYVSGKAENTTSNVLNGITNAVSKPLKSYPSAKRKTIQSFIDAVDQKIRDFAESVKSGDKTFRREKISDVSDRAASDIGDLLGIDVSGYTNNINTNGMQHIINRHGENGVHDSTMAIYDDIARVGWVLENYDSVELLTENGEQMYSSEFRDSNDNPAPQIRFVKKIDGTYYVVEAACENKYKKLWVQSTYLQKNEDVTQAPAAGNQTNHETNAQSALASPSSLTSIPDSVAGVNGENVDPLAQLARETVEARYDAENGAGLDGISAEGKAILGDEAVEIADIADAGNGKVSVKLADGRTINAAELSFPETGEAELWRVIGKYAEDADSARALLEEYRNGSLDAYKYARGVEEGFLYGKLNMSPKEMELQGSYVNLLDPAQRNMAYKQGQIAGEKKAKQTRQQQENIDSIYKQAKAVLEQKGTDAGEHSVQLTDGLTVEKMGKTQRPSYELAKQIAPAVKADIRIYDGGKEWGYYDHKTDTICLNINAKWSGVSMMTFTLAHELVHRAKRGSPVKYQAFADFLIQQYGKQGASVNEMVQQQMQAAEESGISMTYEEAFEEVICDACQKMLVDTDAGKRLAEFGAKSEQNKSIVKQFGQWLQELLQKLRRIFRNVEPDSLAAQEFQKFDDNVKQILADMFVDMSMDAGEKLSTIKAAGMTEKIATDEGGVKHKYEVPGIGSAEITEKDIAVLRSIGRISVNQFSSQDLKKAQKWAQRFWKDLNVKSPFFRVWFGDWRALSTAPAEIVHFAYGETGKLNYNKRTVKCRDMNGKKILVDDTVIEDSLHYAKKNGDEKQIRKLLGKVDEILEKGILLDTRISKKSSGNKKGSTQFMHYLYTPVAINGAPFIAKLSVEEYDLTGKTRAYNLQRIELSTLSRAQFAEMITQNREKYAYSADALTVAQLHEFVKQKDSGFQPKPSSKVVNPDNTPMVVYHGTNAEFNAFDKRKAKNGVFGKGFYFAPSKGRASAYGSVKVLEAYLAVRTPYVVQDSMGFTADDYRSMQNQFGIQDKITDQNVAKILQQQGYDGIIAEDGNGKIKEVVAFEPTQIKSATDNIGTFDGTNADIRYKLPASKDAANRGMLVDLFEQMVTDSNEYRALQNYKKNIDQMLAFEEKVDRLTEEIRRVSFAEGPRDMEYLNNLKAQRKKAVAELNRFDNILLGLEKSGVLRAMIERNRQVVRQESYKKAREYYREKNEKREAEIRQYYRESRRKAVERHDKAQVRQRIRKNGDNRRANAHLFGKCTQ